MFRIGEFSRLAQMPVKTLRYYDEIGLLQPAQTDSFTGYRYYTFGQLARLNRILALKGLGFSLGQIQDVLDSTLTVDELRGMLRLRQAQLERQIADANSQLVQVEIRLRQIEQEYTPMADILVKNVPAITVAGAREVVPTPAEMRERCLALNNHAAQFIQREKLSTDWVSLALYYDNQNGIHVEMAYAVQAAKPNTSPDGLTQVHTLPASTMAYAVYQGSYDDFGAVGRLHGAIHEWAAANGYRLTGASREWYLQPPQTPDDPHGVMEIQYPVEKI